MPDFPSYSLDELVQRARDHVRLRQRSADVSYGSDYDIWSRIQGFVAFQLQKQSESLVRLADPLKSFGSFLREHADTYGVGKALSETSYAAQTATGVVIIRSATAAQTQSAGSVLTAADGTTYTLDLDTTTPASASKVLRVGHRSGRQRLYQGHAGGGFVSPAAGEVYSYDATGEYAGLYAVDNGSQLKRHLVDLYTPLSQTPSIGDTLTQVYGVVATVTASVAGAAGNRDPGDVLTISSPHGTIVATATVLRMSGGRDALTPAQMQAAMHDLLGVRLGPMSLSEIRDLVLRYPSIPLRECFIFPGLYGPGSYALMPVREDGNFLAQVDLDAIRNYVEASTSPIDKFYTTQTSEARDNLVTLEVRVAPNMGPDWTMPSGRTAALTVQPGSTATRVYVDSIPSDLAVGHRVVISSETVGSPYDGYIVERRVSAVSGGSLYFEVSEPLPLPPTGTYGFVTPGGPLSQRIIDALYAHYDAQAPSLDTGVDRYIYPAPTQTNDVDGLIAAVTAVEGVLDATGYYTGTPTLALGAILVPQATQIKMWA